MNIGIFDSGLGGLIVMKSIVKALPEYNYIYFGDTANMPYGEKSQVEIYRHTRAAVEFLFDQDCKLVIIACNTASAKALRKLQQQWLPKYYPGRRVLGVIVPTLEAIPRNDHHIALIATPSTVTSRAYVRELKKIHPRIRVTQKSLPRLAPLIEQGKKEQAIRHVRQVIQSLPAADALVLACTHYDLIKQEIRRAFPGEVYSQDELIPAKLSDYLRRHPEIKKTLSKGKDRQFYVSKITRHIEEQAKRWFGKKITLQVSDSNLL